jgi:serine/threonine protein kinase
MTLLCQPGTEPIAGYQLVERLGTGGYGEVWKATAPGGLTKAIKMVYGHMQETRAEQELKALGRIKEVRHPFILSLERFEIIDNQLVIVMELADKSLMDRFQECRLSGMSGIPRAELLAYLLDAADALDYMGEQYGLQHLDIKPQNLLIVGGRIKLADFGLVKGLEASSAAAGMTIMYATPEALDGRVSRYSDQYSLAIVYQEMLTGSRPFPGTTPYQLAAQHSRCAPLLDSLSLQDRPAIARALSKVPEQRFPTCREMVQNLLAAGDAAVKSKPPAQEGAATPPSGLRPLVRPVAHPVRTVGQKPPNAVAGSDNRLNEPTVPVPTLRPEHPESRIAPRALRPTARPRSIVGGTQLRPTLFLGVGGIAGWTLRRLRDRLHSRPREQATTAPIRLLLLDTDRAALQTAEQGEGGAALESTETLHVPLRRPEHYRPQSQKLLRWLDRRWLYNLPRSLLTEGARPLGRLALVDNATEVLARLRETVAGLVGRPAAAREAEGAANSPDGAEVQAAECPQVFLVASTGGGTAGGMLIGLAYAVQQVLEEFQLPADSLCAILVHATGQRRGEDQLARLNAYATLVELQHFSSPAADYPGDPENGLAAFGPEASPFRDAYIVHLGDQLDSSSAEAATETLAEYLYLNAATDVGPFLNQWRQRTEIAGDGETGQAQLRLFGIHRLSCPCQALSALAADLFCKHVIDRWCGQQAEWEDKRLDKDAPAQIAELGLAEEKLADQLHAVALGVFGEEPEQSFLKIVADFSLDQNLAAAPPLAAQMANQALAKIDIFLGQGGDEQGRKSGTTPIEKELRKHGQALSEQLGRAVVDWLLTLVENPEKRLRGAHQAAKSSHHRIATTSKNLRKQLVELRSHRAQMRCRLAAGDFGSKTTAIAWLRSPRNQHGGTSPTAKVLVYCWLRLQESILENILQVFEAVTGRLVGFMQELRSGRVALRQFGATLVPMALPQPVTSEISLPNSTVLLPDKCNGLEEAARSVFKRFGSKLCQPFEQAFEVEILQPLGGLWALASGSGELVQRVKDELQRRALVTLLDATRDIDAAKLFLESRHDPNEALRDLLAYIVSISPNLEVAKSSQHLVLALPDSPAGAILRPLLDSALADVAHTILNSERDMVLCHEVAHLPFGQLAQILIGEEVRLADTACHVLTRNDIPWSHLPLGSAASA